MTGLGKQKIILGFPWLHKYNLIIDWKKGEIKWQPLKIDWRALVEKGKQIRKAQQPKVEEVVDEEEMLNQTTNRLETKEKETILMELDETTSINKINWQLNWLLRKIAKRKRKRMNSWYRKNSTNTWTSLVKKRLIDSLKPDHGITKSK